MHTINLKPDTLKKLDCCVKTKTGRSPSDLTKVGLDELREVVILHLLNNELKEN